MDRYNSSEDHDVAALSRLLGRTEQGIERRHERLASLEAEVAAVRAETKRLRQIESVISSVKAEYESGHWCEVVRQLDRAKDLGPSLDHFVEGTSADIVSLRQTAAERADDALSELSSSLPAALDSAGLVLDPLSRFPSFKLRSGFFEIRINKSKWEAQVIVRHGPTLKIAADLELIINAVLGEEARCFGCPVELPTFLTRLRAAYASALGTEKPRPLSLDDVRQALKVPEMPRDEFAVALAAVLSDQPPEAEGMNLDHTKSIETGFLLPGFEDRGYFGHISFTIS